MMKLAKKTNWRIIKVKIQDGSQALAQVAFPNTGLGAKYPPRSDFYPWRKFFMDFALCIQGKTPTILRIR